MTGRYTTVLESTMLADHTKFCFDLAGGTFKRTWRKFKAIRMAEIAQVVEKLIPMCVSGGGERISTVLQLLPD